MRTAHSIRQTKWSVPIESIQVATELMTNIKYRNDLDDDKSDAVTV